MRIGPARWILLVGGLTASRGLDAATLTVTTTADSGAGSLRDAITQSNASGGTQDTIAFAIPGAGPHAITPQTSLPALTDPVVIDGSTQPGFNGTPLIELDGTTVGGFQYGLNISAGGSTVRGLAINRFPGGGGIQLSGAGGNTIAGNFIGTNPAGTAALPTPPACSSGPVPPATRSEDCRPPTETSSRETVTA